jgi:3-oxoacyl-[acyl-carrier protein] reductase
MKINSAVALITGASRGIGKATALTLANEGAKLSLNCSKSAADLESVVESIREKGGEASTCIGDVTSFEDCRRIVNDTVETYGRIDILVNNAGSFQVKPLCRMDPQDWESMFKVHVFGVFNMIRHTLPYMLERKSGVIVNMSSFYAFRPLGEGRTHYSSAKAALMGLTRALALEVAGNGVRVVGLAPGLIDTGLIDRSNLEQRLKSIPLGRLGRAEEVAQVIRCLIENDFATGETWVVSGGE